MAVPPGDSGRDAVASVLRALSSPRGGADEFAAILACRGDRPLMDDAQTPAPAAGTRGGCRPSCNMRVVVCVEPHGWRAPVAQPRP